MITTLPQFFFYCNAQIYIINTTQRFYQ